MRSITPKKARFIRSDPRIFPIIIEFSLTIHTADSDVNSSGRLVTAASMTPPMNAPEILLFLSITSTYLPSLIDRNTTRATNAT